jgi:hypothetical protein
VHWTQNTLIGKHVSKNQWPHTHIKFKLKYVKRTNQLITVRHNERLWLKYNGKGITPERVLYTWQPRQVSQTHKSGTAHVSAKQTVETEVDLNITRERKPVSQ